MAMKDEMGQDILKAPADPEPWVFPPDTKCIPEEEYVDLEVIDLSLFHADSCPSETESELISRTLHALRTTGFLAVKNHGLSTAYIHRHFAFGKLFSEGVSEEEKMRLHARISQEGSWAGYKPQGYYKRPDGAHDYLEHYDFYPYTALESNLPEAAKPYLSEFRQFIEFNHYVLLRKILAIISLGLGLDRDTLWHLHHRGSLDDGALRGGPEEVKWNHSKDHLRYAVYHPPSEEDRKKRNRLWLPGHTDLGSVTFNYSHPVLGLQLLTREGKWRYVRHYADHIIVDLGDSMEFLTGGVLKASPHRVIEPPEDQRHLIRPGLFFFVPFLPDVKLALIDNPALRALGAKDLFEEYYKLGGEPVTSNEWLVLRSKLVGTKRVKRPTREPIDVLEDIHYRYNP